MLGPTLLRVFGLDLVGLAFLNQLLFWVALVVEPVASLLVDVRSRRVLLVWGSAAVAGSLLLMGGAVSYGLLLAGFVVYGMGSGPLAHTADIVLVESARGDAERVFTRATLFDTCGALLAPAVVAVTATAGLSWRVPLLMAAAVAGGFAILSAITAFPRPPVSGSHGGLARQLGGHLREVASSRRARRWLLFALLLELFEAPAVLRYVWLAEDVSMGQAGAAAYAVAEQAVALGALAVLERRQRHASVALPAVCIAVGALYACWLAAPGVVGKLVLGAPLAFLASWIWPISRARTLQAVPGRAGAVSAVSTLTPVVPGPLLVGVAAQIFGLTAAFALTAVPLAAALAVVAALAQRADRDGDQPSPKLSPR